MKSYSLPSRIADIPHSDSKGLLETEDDRGQTHTFTNFPNHPESDEDEEDKSNVNKYSNYNLDLTKTRLFLSKSFMLHSVLCKEQILVYS